MLRYSLPGGDQAAAGAANTAIRTPMHTVSQVLGAVEACGADQPAVNERTQDEVVRRVARSSSADAPNASGSVSRASRRRCQNTAASAAQRRAHRSRQFLRHGLAVRRPVGRTRSFAPLCSFVVQFELRISSASLGQKPVYRRLTPNAVP
jgi:hypothetical protein